MKSIESMTLEELNSLEIAIQAEVDHRLMRQPRAPTVRISIMGVN